MPKAAQKRVLIVDDHPPTRAVIRSILAADKNDAPAVTEAGSGSEALKALEANAPFDLVLLDVNLPDLDGFTLCKAIRRVDDQVPIVFLTAKTELQDYAAGREAGGDSYLVKPIARAALRSTVQLFTSIGRNRKPKGARADG